MFNQWTPVITWGFSKISKTVANACSKCYLRTEGARSAGKGKKKRLIENIEGFFRRILMFFISCLTLAKLLDFVTWSNGPYYLRSLLTLLWLALSPLFELVFLPKWTEINVTKKLMQFFTKMKKWKLFVFPINITSTICIETLIGCKKILMK